MGRKSTPAAVKKLRGNPGKRKVVADTAPMRAGQHVDDGKSVATFPVPKPPAYLTKFAKAEWKRLAPWMRAQGLLRDADLSLFEQRCSLVGEIHADQVFVNKWGATYQHNGVHRTRPEVRRISDNRRQLRAIDSEFGLTPAARARVGHVTGDRPVPAQQPALPGTEAPKPEAEAPDSPPTDLGQISDADFLRGPIH